MPKRDARRRKKAGRPDLIVAATTAGLLLLAGLYLWLLGGTAPPNVPAIGGPFALTQDNHQVVTDRDFRGRYLLVYFGYTSCADVCPTTLDAIADAMSRLGNRSARLQPVFITVDPERDTPAVMREYVRAFSPSIIGLSGTATQIRAVEQEYRIVSDIDRRGAGKYSIDHTAAVFLVGPDGRYLAALSAIETGAELAKRLAGYLE
jgi:protein SCO1/2